MVKIVEVGTVEIEPIGSRTVISNWHFIPEDDEELTMLSLDVFTLREIINAKRELEEGLSTLLKVDVQMLILD